MSQAVMTQAELRASSTDQVCSMRGQNDQATPMLPSIYDTYLCREPAGDVPLLIRNGPDEYTALLRTLQRSADHFSGKNQFRVVERLQFEMAKLHMEHQQWERAMRVLLPLWQTLSWRKAGWWALLEQVDWAVKQCASNIKDAETLVAVEWELMSRYLTQRQDSQLGFANILEGLKPLNFRPKAVIRAENILSCISATFAFESSQGNVGEPLQTQLVLSSSAHENSNPITISRIKIVFDGGLKNVQLDHDISKVSHTTNCGSRFGLHLVQLEKSSSDADFVPSSPASVAFLSGRANLVIGAGCTKALTFTNIPRDAGDVEVSSISLFVSEQDFDIELVLSEYEHMYRGSIFFSTGNTVSQKELKSNRSNAVKILPKPPRLRLELLNLERDYYTDEIVIFELDVINEEQEKADVTLDVRLLAPLEAYPVLQFVTEEAENPLEEAENSLEEVSRKDQNEKPDTSRHLGFLNPSDRRRHVLEVHRTSRPTRCVLEINAYYHLSSDPDTPISKRLTTELIFQLPFEANFTFSPVTHPDPWPSYFNMDETQESASRAKGLTQRWTIFSRITSIATTALVIERMEPQISEPPEMALYKLNHAHQDPPTILPGGLHEIQSILDFQKMDLDDRRSIYLDLHLSITWRREGSSTDPITTSLPLPELLLPFGEPRVLAEASTDTTVPSDIHLSYVVENPSIYPLTFDLTMETSEEFAFSGPKNITVQLVPLSRYLVRYVLLPFAKGVWITPHFKVFDTHFHKTLKVLGTGEGMRNDKRGVAVWVDVEG